MTATTSVLTGAVHGRTIELNEDAGLAEETVVRVILRLQEIAACSVDQICAAIEATAGACADESESWDEFDKWYREQRQLGR